VRRTFVVLAVSHSSRYSLQKITTIYLNLSKLCQKYCQSLFPPGMDSKMAFFNDVTMTSSLRSVVPVLIRHSAIFQSHGLSGWFAPKIMTNCLNLSKLQPKYCWSLFSGHNVHSVTRRSQRGCVTIGVVHTILCVVENLLSQSISFKVTWLRGRL